MVAIALNEKVDSNLIEKYEGLFIKGENYDVHPKLASYGYS